MTSATDPPQSRRPNHHASGVQPDDFRGLRHLADRLGDDFIAGIVLHTGTQTLPFGDRMRAMPVSALWEVG